MEERFPVDDMLLGDVVEQRNGAGGLVGSWRGFDHVAPIIVRGPLADRDRLLSDALAEHGYSACGMLFVPDELHLSPAATAHLEQALVDAFAVPLPVWPGA